MNKELQYFLNLKKNNLIRLRDLLNSNGNVKELQQAKDTNDLLNYNISQITSQQGPQGPRGLPVDTNLEYVNPYSDFPKFTNKMKTLPINQVEQRIDQTFLVPLEPKIEEPIKLNYICPKPVFTRIRGKETQESQNGSYDPYSEY